MNTRLLLGVTLASLLASFGVSAQIYEYKDASGRTVYTDHPPTGAAVKSRTVSKDAASEPAPATAAPVPKSAVDREMEFKKRQKEAQEQSAKSEKEAADKAARAEACKGARQHLQLLESGERLATRDSAGERVFIDDDQRAKDIERTRKQVSELCR